MKRMHYFAAVFMVIMAMAGTATAANRIEFTIDIAGGKWQVTSDASTTLFNWRDAIEYNAYIGHSHYVWFTNVYRADYPKGFGKVLSFMSNTAQNGNTSRGIAS